MAQKFFRKELAASNPFLVKGTRVPFEMVQGNRGLLALEETPENAELIAALVDVATKRKYGVVMISEAEYLEKKKLLLPSAPSSRRKQDKLKVMPQLLKPKPSPAKAVPVANPPPTKPTIVESPKFNQFEADAGIALAREGKPLPEGASESMRHGFSVVDPATKLRTDGPTVEEFTKAGYKAENYPPQGYAVKPSSKAAPAFVPRTAPKPKASSDE